MKKVDVHTHYGEMPCMGEMNSLEGLRTILRDWDIKACLCSSARAVFHDMTSGNEELAKALDQTTEIFGYIYVDPRTVELSIQQIERFSKHGKFLGIKSRPDYHGQTISSPASREILHCARQHQLPLLLHTYGPGTARSAVESAESFSLPIILGHMGGPTWQETIDIAVEAENIYVEPCCTCKDVGKLDYAIRKLGKERVLFGTDLTLLHPAWSIGVVEGSSADEQTKEFIYWRNAVRIFPQVESLLQE